MHALPLLQKVPCQQAPTSFLQTAQCVGDMVQGRRWAEVRGHLADMWGMALRCADDIKESVRTAAAGALRALRGLTLRLCDPAATPPADAGEAVALALPLLLVQGARELAHTLHLFLLPLLPFTCGWLQGKRARRAACHCACKFPGHAPD